ELRELGDHAFSLLAMAVSLELQAGRLELDDVHAVDPSNHLASDHRAQLLDAPERRECLQLLRVVRVLIGPEQLGAGELHFGELSLVITGGVKRRHELAAPCWPDVCAATSLGRKRGTPTQRLDS